MLPRRHVKDRTHQCPRLSGSLTGWGATYLYLPTALIVPCHKLHTLSYRHSMKNARLQQTLHAFLPFWSFWKWPHKVITQVPSTAYKGEVRQVNAAYGPPLSFLLFSCTAGGIPLKRTLGVARSCRNSKARDTLQRRGWWWPEALRGDTAATLRPTLDQQRGRLGSGIWKPLLLAGYPAGCSTCRFQHLPYPCPQAHCRVSLEQSHAPLCIQRNAFAGR